MGCSKILYTFLNHHLICLIMYSCNNVRGNIETWYSCLVSIVIQVIRIYKLIIDAYIYIYIVSVLKVMEFTTFT